MFKFLYNIIHYGVAGLSVIVSIANNKERDYGRRNAKLGEIVELHITQVGLDFPTPPLPFSPFLLRY